MADQKPPSDHTMEMLRRMREETQQGFAELKGPEGPSVRKRTLAYCTQCCGVPSRAARDLAEPRLEAEFEIAHLHDAVDGAGADFRRQGEDFCDERLEALDFCGEPGDFPRLDWRGLILLPSAQLLLAETEPLLFFAIDLVDAIEGGVIEQMRPRTRLGQDVSLCHRLRDAAVDQ